jgi:hypothetical protein
MPAKVWLLNLIVLAVLLEADLGHRKIGWFRVLRPLIVAVGVVAAYASSLPTNGHNIALETIGALAGVLLGLGAHLFISVYFDPARPGRKGTGARGRAVSRAGAGYAIYLVLVFGSRLLFIYGTEHWFPRSLNHFLLTHQLSANGLTDALMFMAIAMALARSVVLAVRGRTATRHAATAEGFPAGALNQDGTLS